MKIEITKDSKTSIFTSIIIFILGALLFSKPNEVVKFVSYVFGAIFAIYSIYSLYRYYKDRLNMNLVVGLVCLIIALIFIFLADVIEAITRYIIGGWVLFSGLTKFIYDLNYVDRRDNRFVSSLIISILLIIMGFYIILYSNLALSYIGVLLMLYAGLEIAGFAFDIIDSKKPSKSKEEITDAVIVSDNKQTKKDKKNKKKNK